MPRSPDVLLDRLAEAFHDPAHYLNRTRLLDDDPQGRASIRLFRLTGDARAADRALRAGERCDLVLRWPARPAALAREAARRPSLRAARSRPRARRDEPPAREIPRPRAAPARDRPPYPTPVTGPPAASLRAGPRCPRRGAGLHSRRNETEHARLRGHRDRRVLHDLQSRQGAARTATRPSACRPGRGPARPARRVRDSPPGAARSRRWSGPSTRTTWCSSGSSTRSAST